MQLEPLLKLRIPPANSSVLIACLVVILPFLFLLPLWVGAISMLLFGWRLLHDAQLLPLPNKYLKTLLSLSLFMLIFWQYHTVLSRQAGASLLIVLISLKLLETHQRRDQYVSLFLGYFLVAVSFLFNQAIWMGAYLISALFLLSLALIAINHEPLQQCGSAALLKHHARRLAIMSLQALPLALILFVFFPRLSSPLWSLPDDAHTASTGLSDRLAPGAVNQLSDNPRVVFRVQFKGTPPGSDKLYWRALVMDRYDGWQWRAAPFYGSDRATTRIKPLSAPLHYQVTLEPQIRNWLYVLEMPYSKPSQGRLNHDGLLRMPQAVKKLMRYELSSVLDYKLSQVTPQRDNLLLPADSSPRARQLAQKWRQQAKTPEAIVAKALGYIREQEFFYTRKPPLLFDDPVDEFLFETRRGYCEHYASSFVFLMRAAGVPARVVIGYQGGEYNAVDNYFIVRQSDAHAWAEVWLPQRGWQRVDPTSAIPLHRTEQTPVQLNLRPDKRLQLLSQQPWLQRLWKRSRLMLDTVNYRWKDWFIDFNLQRQQRFFAALGWESISRYSIGLLLITFCTVTLVLLLMFWPRLRWQRRDPLGRLYNHYCKKMARAGLPRQAWEGAEEYAERICTHQPRHTTNAKRIAWLYNRLRYGHTHNRHNLTELQALISQVSFK